MPNEPFQPLHPGDIPAGSMDESRITDHVVHFPEETPVELGYDRLLQEGETFLRGGKRWLVERVELADQVWHVWVVESPAESAN